MEIFSRFEKRHLFIEHEGPVLILSKLSVLIVRVPLSLHDRLKDQILIFSIRISRVYDEAIFTLRNCSRVESHLLFFLLMEVSVEDDSKLYVTSEKMGVEIYTFFEHSMILMLELIQVSLE